MASNPNSFLPSKATLNEPTADVTEAKFDDSVAVAIGIPFCTTTTSTISMVSFCNALDAYPYALKFGPLPQDSSIGCHSALDNATAQRLVWHLRNSLLVDDLDDIALIFDDTAT
jgi:hypothetical protein